MSACPFVRHRSGSRLASYTAPFKVLSIKSWGRLFLSNRNWDLAGWGLMSSFEFIKFLYFLSSFWDCSLQDLYKITLAPLHWCHGAGVVLCRGPWRFLNKDSWFGFIIRSYIDSSLYTQCVWKEMSIMQSALDGNLKHVFLDSVYCQ